VSKLEITKAILQEIKSLENDLLNSNERIYDSAEKQYYQLLTEFYAENEEILSPHQYEISKRDYEYFLKLIELVAVHLEVEEKRRATLH
jgi:hypothetical protein